MTTWTNLSAKTSPLTSKYASVVVDIPVGEVDHLYTYLIKPEHEEVAASGMRVMVPFGRGSRFVMGFVLVVMDESGLPDSVDPDGLKEIEGFLDDFPVLTSETIALAEWMRDKYYATLSQCIKAIVPAAKPNGKFPVARKSAKSASKTETTGAGFTLTKEQESAVDLISKCLKDSGSQPILLHGVTGSGKTEVYIVAIGEVLAKGRSAIVLVPEIALTPQMVNLFTARFGSLVAVTHSRLTPGERFVIWKKALDGDVRLIIGPRSAVFAPFADLGLIIIDEEHEHTYHSETTPKYDTRAVALKRAEISGALLVLGSATPSLESYYRTTDECAFSPRYNLLKMPERVNKTTPAITILDMRQEMVRGNMSMFATDFIIALKETLDSQRQAIIFLNRRGYSSFVSCRWCGNVCVCSECRVNHTYHQDKNHLICHYCGKGIPMPTNCPACGSAHIRRSGTGTQKIEEELGRLFPDTGILRMDMDTTKGKLGHAKILDAFRNGEAQVLIGTQMVAKGLDFPRVTMVGVVSADMSLFTGDFRAGEYTFQLLTQVAGRAGRASDTGRVFIQTYNPEHYAVKLAMTADYETFYKHEMTIRRTMCYPPLSHVFSVMFIGSIERDVIAALQKLGAIMDYCIKREERRGNVGRFEVIGLSPAFVSKIKNQYRWKILLKSAEERPLMEFVKYTVKKLRENDPLTGININLSLNPVMME